MSEKKATKDTAITYHNKDVVSKLFGENLRNKSFAVYGLNIPKIVEVQPTNLPSIEANELRIDNLFLLEDGSLALVDYESEYVDESKIKYLNYIARTLKRNMQQGIKISKIRMIVIYTADVKPQETKACLNIGCLQFTLEEAFLSEIDSKTVEKKLQAKINRHENLSEDEQMELMILPLTYKSDQEKSSSIKKYFELAKQITNSKTQTFVLAGMLVFADKVVNEEDSRAIKEWIMMTKVARLFEEEKFEYAKEQAEKMSCDMAKRLLCKGMSIDDVADVVETLSKAKIRELAKEIQAGE